jgi:hypothetical protein
MTHELGPAPFPNWPPQAPHEDGADSEPAERAVGGCSARRDSDGGTAEERRLGKELAEQTRRTTELGAKLALAARRERELRELLLDAHDQLLRRDDELQAALAAALDRRPQRTPAGIAGPAAITHLDYKRLVLQLRGVVEATLPEGAVVAVVSKGDDELLEFAGRRGLHFPLASDGGYAGHHPADSASAINLVESARASGAQFLLFPATASWWLSHYAELTDHLDSRYSRLVDDAVCVLFALGTPPQPASVVTSDYPGLVLRVRDTVHTHVPMDATVLVVSRGDDELLNLYGRRAWHFPRGDDGGYAGHYPRDSEAAIDHLERLHSRGASHLVVPATAVWWLQYYEGFRAHLDKRYESLVEADDTCVLYELGPVRTTRLLPGVFHRRFRHELRGR